MSPSRIRFCFVLTAILILTAHRLPAPIQEIVETPSPTAAPEKSTNATPIPRATQSVSPAQTGRALFAGTWTGRIDMQRAGEVDVTLVVSPDGASIQQTSKLAKGNRPLNYDGNMLSWTGGIKGEIPWTMKLNPDERTAIVTRTFAGKTASAIFKRASTNDVENASGPQRKWRRLQQKPN
jgi:hypothetical protein